jgi:hypothetical protein
MQRIASVRASGAAVGAKQKREGSVLKEGEGQGPRLFSDQQVFSKGRCWGISVLLRGVAAVYECVYFVNVLGH